MKKKLTIVAMALVASSPAYALDDWQDSVRERQQEYEAHQEDARQREKESQMENRLRALEEQQYQRDFKDSVDRINGR